MGKTRACVNISTSLAHLSPFAFSGARWVVHHTPLLFRSLAIRVTSPLYCVPES